MKNPTRATVLAAALFLATSLPNAGCGDDSSETSSGSGGGGTASCGTTDDPDLFTVTDVSPGSATPVDSLTVVHAFRVVDAPAVVQQLAFQLATTHTAGAPTPAQLSFTVTQERADLVYTASAVTWANAGHVELSVPTLYEAEGCIYAFPSPLFSYDFAPADGTGGAGAGGDGGAGGGGDGGSGGA